VSGSKSLMRSLTKIERFEKSMDEYIPTLRAYAGSSILINEHGDQLSGRHVSVVISLESDTKSSRLSSFRLPEDWRWQRSTDGYYMLIVCGLLFSDYRSVTV
jgi:hypothetical protein